MDRLQAGQVPAKKKKSATENTNATNGSVETRKKDGGAKDGAGDVPPLPQFSPSSSGNQTL